MSIQFEIQQVLNLIDRKMPFAFYGTYSRLGLGFSSSNGGLVLSFAKALDPDNNKGKKQKGVEIYDNKNIKMFTMSPSECVDLLKNIPKIEEGKYQHIPKKGEKVNEKYKGTYQVVHYRENVATKLFISRSVDKNDKYIGLKLTIIPGTNDKDDIISFVVRGSELTILINFVNWAGNTTPQVLQSFKMLMNYVSSQLYKNKDRANGNGDKKNSKKNTETDSNEDENISDTVIEDYSNDESSDSDEVNHNDDEPVDWN